MMTDAQRNKIISLLGTINGSDEQKYAYLATEFKGKVKVTQKGDSFTFEATKRDASAIISEMMKGANQ
jgi:hypothetical protein